MKRFLILTAIALDAFLTFGQSIPVPGGGRAMRAADPDPSNGQVPIWNSATGKWVPGAAGAAQTPWTSDINAAGYNLTGLGSLSVGSANTNGSTTIFGSSQDIGFTITNNLAGNYRWPLPGPGLNGQYAWNFSGSNVTLTASAVIATEVDGSPSVTANTIKFPNGTLTDNGDGSVTYTPTASGSGNGYVLTAGAGNFNPADSTVYLFGGIFGMAPTTSANFTRFRIQVPKTGTVIKWTLHVYIDGTTGTGETVAHVLRLNDATDFGTINATYNAVNVDGASSTLSQAVTAGDYICVKFTAPAWVTNPTACYFNAQVYIE
jgi:hypothetical protein